MHDTSARLVERVLPAASYRQWVLTVAPQTINHIREVHRSSLQQGERGGQVVRRQPG